VRSMFGKTSLVLVFIERKLMFTFDRYMLSPVRLSSIVCLTVSVCRLSVPLLRPTQPVEIFGNFSTPFNGTLAIH